MQQYKMAIFRYCICFDDLDGTQGTNKLRSVGSKMTFNVYVYSYKKYIFWSPCRAVHSCNCDKQLTITLQQTFISDPNFDLDALFRPST